VQRKIGGDQILYLDEALTIVAAFGLVPIIAEAALSQVFAKFSRGSKCQKAPPSN
jgi:hypothetical protein